MVRESLQPGSRYFGVFRPGSGSGLRVQVRIEPDSATTVFERRIGPTWTFGTDFEQGSLVHVRLDVSGGGRSCRGFGSVDGVEWVELGAYDFDVPLTLHGLAVSSHGQRRGAKYLFVVPGSAPRPRFDVDAAIDGVGGPADGWADWSGTSRWRVNRFNRSTKPASRR